MTRTKFLRATVYVTPDDISELKPLCEGEYIVWVSKSYGVCYSTVMSVKELAPLLFEQSITKEQDNV